MAKSYIAPPGSKLSKEERFIFDNLVKLEKSIKQHLNGPEANNRYYICVYYSGLPNTEDTRLKIVNYLSSFGKTYVKGFQDELAFQYRTNMSNLFLSYNRRKLRHVQKAIKFLDEKAGRFIKYFVYSLEETI